MTNDYTEIKEEVKEKEASETLEDIFEAEQNRVHTEIEKHIEEAQKILNKCEKLSEETGIPFDSPIHNFSSRQYWPKSFDEKWKYLNIEEFDLYKLDYDEDGWEYWSASSLRC